MGQRLLTAEFVDKVRPPRKGERWIADTAVRGFGLRLWAKGRPGKSFAIRTIDARGRPVRRSLGQADGRYLDHARERAQEMLGELKGRPRRLASVQKWRLLIPNLKLDEWIDKVLKVQARSGAKPQYLEQADYLYKLYAVPCIGEMTLGKLTLDDVRACIRTAADTPSQARKLQSFLHLALSFAGKFHRDSMSIAWGLRETSNYDYDPFQRPTLPLRPDDLRRLFQRLSRETQEQQQALFLALAFCLGVRPKELLRAKWTQIANGRFFPIRQSQWRARADATEISGPVSDIIENIRGLNYYSFPVSDFIFPSNRSGKSGHLTSYSRYWESIRSELDWPRVPLFEIIRHFRRPWYFEMRNRGFAPSSIRAIVDTMD